MQLPGESTDPSIGLRISASLIDISLYRANLFQVLCSDRSAIFTRITSSVQSKHGVDNLNLLMHCGDILRNPGPEWKYPCGVCQKPVKNNQKGLQCDSCDLWYHTNCCRVNDIVYNALANSSCSWICCGCGLPNFSARFLTYLIYSCRIITTHCHHHQHHHQCHPRVIMEPT